VGRDKDVCAAERVVSPVGDVVENAFNHCQLTEDLKSEQRYVRCVKKKEEAGKRIYGEDVEGWQAVGNQRGEFIRTRRGHFSQNYHFICWNRVISFGIFNCEREQAFSLLYLA
jgi:hypothetical protein